MFFSKQKKYEKELKKQKRQQIYDRVYAIHEKAIFLCYIEDAYLEKYEGKSFMKLEGVVAKGTGTLEDTYLLFDCEGRQKAAIEMEELFCGKNSVTQLEGGDKKVALYPKQQDISYRAGDIICMFQTGEKNQVQKEREE